MGNILPLRGLGSSGIIRDMEPYNLPLSAWSRGNNVRFEAGKVRRAPAFRTVAGSLSAAPAFMAGFRSAQTGDFLIYTAKDGTMYRYQGTETNVTPEEFVTNSETELPFSAAFLDQTAYINRPSDVPYYLVGLETEFAPLTDYGWDETWRAGVIRSWRDSLIALDVEKDGVSYPNMVKISDAVDGSGLPPASWDHTDPTKLAVENPLPDLTGRLLDGAPLQNVFILYSQNEAWVMEAIGGQFLYSFKKLFSGRGIIATGCVAEANGRHYVWGEHDIYVHSGNGAPQSIIDGYNKEFLFGTMNKDRASRFFVHHDTILDQIIFAYIGADEDAGFPNTEHCNRAAIYDIQEGHWTFQDLPNVTAAAEVIINGGTPWEDLTSNWTDAGGSWDGAENVSRSALLMTAQQDDFAGSPRNAIYAFDRIEDGSLVDAPLATDILKPAFVERRGIDLDEVGAQLRQLKSVRRLYPQARVFGVDGTLSISVGGSMTPLGEPVYSSEVTFDPVTQYKVDHRQDGRYLNIRIDSNGNEDFLFSGMDLEYTLTGRR